MDANNNNDAFEVHKYDLGTLIALTAKLSASNTETQISKKSHPGYLDSYFNALKVTTIVVENYYVDRDYLEDFAAYYVRCFQDYKRHCARLHFFTADFTKDQLQAMLCGDTKALSPDVLQNSYCGFIVIKPLPQTVFGRTCLKTYPPVDGREFPVARRFYSNLFGVPLDISDTLPFQEQDNIAAACATSALWSVLQGTAKEFQHSLLTPIEITRAAIELLPAETRMIPNRGGLSTAMMAEAIRAVGLEPLMLAAQRNDEITLRAVLYAYLRARIPIILGVSLVDNSDAAKPSSIGDHAVAVTGFCLSGSPSPSLGTPEFRLLASRVEKIYAHDDQVGPFARMIFDGTAISTDLGDGQEESPISSLSTSWRAANGEIGKVRAIPLIVLIPLYHKIRIPYEDIIRIVVDFHKFLAASKELSAQARATEIEWDIHLTTINEFKTDLQNSTQLSGEAKAFWLTTPGPRFLWRATAVAAGSRTIDLLFDATDIHTSDGVHGVLCYDDALQAALTVISSSPRLEELDELPGALRILRSLRDQKI